MCDFIECEKTGTISRDIHGRGPWYCVDHARRLGLLDREASEPYPQAKQVPLPKRISEVAGVIEAIANATKETS